MKKPKHKGRGQKACDEGVLVRELSGYVDVGMGREAGRVAREILAQVRISPGAFHEVVKAVGVTSDPAKWMVELETVWHRQSSLFQLQTNSEMLVLYASVGQWEKAVAYAVPRMLRTAADFTFGIEALLRAGRRKEAGRAARRARQLLKNAKDRFDAACLIQALAAYHAWVGKLDEAFEWWSMAPRDQPFGGSAAIGRLEVCVMQLLGMIEEERRLWRNQPFDFGSEIQLPGNADGLRKETESELERFRRSLEKLVPAERRKELGLEIDGNLSADPNIEGG